MAKQSLGSQLEQARIFIQAQEARIKFLEEENARKDARLEKAKEIYRSMKNQIDSMATTEYQPTKEDCKAAALKYGMAGKLMKGQIHLFDKNVNEWKPLSQIQH